MYKIFWSPGILDYLCHWFLFVNVAKSSLHLKVVTGKIKQTLFLTLSSLWGLSKHFFLHCILLWSGHTYLSDCCQLLCIFFWLWNHLHILGLFSEIFWSSIVDTILGECLHPSVWCAPVNKGEARQKAVCHLPTYLLQPDESVFPFSDLKCEQNISLVSTSLFIFES